MLSRDETNPFDRAAPVLVRAESSRWFAGNDPVAVVAPARSITPAREVAAIGGTPWFAARRSEDWWLASVC